MSHCQKSSITFNTVTNPLDCKPAWAKEGEKSKGQQASLCDPLRSEFRQAVSVIPVFMHKEFQDPELSYLHPSTACRNRGGGKGRGGATSFNWILPVAAPSQFNLSRTVPRNMFLQDLDKKEGGETHPET